MIVLKTEFEPCTPYKPGAVRLGFPGPPPPTVIGYEPGLAATGSVLQHAANGEAE